MDILCPVCRKRLKRNEKIWKCVEGHSFDESREGYLNLNLHNSQSSGDNPEMIRARQRFLAKGYYAFLKNEVDSLLNEEDSLVDLACGEGYYTSGFRCRDKVGIDLSKSGLKIASKRDKGTVYLLNSIFHDPLEDECADKVTTIFAPIAKEEIVRILKKCGEFILVRPDAYHLYELKERLYDRPYLNETEEIGIQGLVLEKQLHISQEAILPKQDIMDLFLMTPYSNTTSREDREKLDRLDRLKIRFCFLIDVFKKAD